MARRRTKRQPEPQVPIWVFVVTTLLSWMLGGVIIGVELWRDSTNVAFMAVAVWLLTAPVVGFRGAVGTLKDALRSWLGASGDAGGDS